MPIIIILIVVGLAVFVQRVLYEKRWFKHLDAEVAFEEKYLTEGSETTLDVTLQNAKLLPLPWVQLKFQLNRNNQVKDAIFESDIFNILFYQKILRKRKVLLKKRGLYEIKALDLLSHDLFISNKFVHALPNRAALTVYPRPLERDLLQVPYEKLMGIVATRRYTLEDPYLFKGIRDYQDSDSFKNINFKASARAGKWLVNTHEYTLDQKVRILLLADKPSSYFDENAYEGGLRYAAGLILALEEDGIPAGLYTNAVDSFDRQVQELEAGCSEHHTNAALELLARLDLLEIKESGAGILEELAQSYEADDFYVIICPCRTREMLDAYERLLSFTEACMFISPISSREYGYEISEGKDLEKELSQFYYYKI